MKQQISILFMVLLLVFATLPLHALDVAAKEGRDKYEDDDDYELKSKKISGADYEDSLKYEDSSKPTQPQREPATFWLQQGESKQLESSLVLTYLGSSQKPTQIACTGEARLCPDGKTYVGRNPNLGCAFDACPGETSNSVSDLLAEGAEKTYVLQGDMAFAVEVLNIEDTNPATVTFKVNGEVTDQIPIGKTAVLKNGVVSLSVLNIALRTAGGDDLVKFTLGTAAVEPPVSDIGVCEQFQMTYKYVAPSQGIVGEPEFAIAPEVTTANVQAVAVDSAMPTKDSNVKEMEVYADAEYAEAIAKKKRIDVAVQTGDYVLDFVEDIIEPTDVTKDILGEQVYKKEVVKESDIDVQPAPIDSTRYDMVSKRVTKLALIIGRQEYMDFSFRNDKVAEELVRILERNGVYVNKKGDWKSQLAAFIKVNNIDVDQFARDLQEAQKQLSLAQIHTYNAFLYLQSNDLDAADREMGLAEKYFAAFQGPMDRVVKEINRWKPLPGQGRSQPIKEESKTFCIIPGEVGYPIILYEKKDNAVLVGYNSWKNEPRSMGVAIDAKNTDVEKSKTSKNQGVCTVESNGAVPVGTRVNVDGVSQYCDPLTKKMLKQKADGEVAENNYECLSNEARNGVCENSLSFLQKIWKSIVGVFGF